MIELHEELVVPFEVKRVVYREMQKRYGNFEKWMKYEDKKVEGSDKEPKNHKWYEKYKFTPEEQNRLRQVNRYDNGVYVTDEHLQVGLFEND